MMNRLLDWVEHNHLRATLIILAALLLLFSVAFCSLANAADATVSWQHPTKNTDGSSIPASGAGSIASTRVEYGSCSGTAFGTKAGEVSVPAPAASTTITDFAAGSTSCFRAYAKNTFGVESGASAVVSKVFPAPTPNPPVLSSTITVAWDLKRGKPARIVGRIPLDLPCGDFVAKAGKYRYYEIPIEAVHLTRKPRSSRVVTRCAAS